jgi:hypothetical protein
MLHLLQRVVDQKAEDAAPGLVSLSDLIKEDTKDVR